MSMLMQACFFVLNAQRILAITDAGDQGLIALRACRRMSGLRPPECSQFKQKPLIFYAQVLVLI